MNLALELLGQLNALRRLLASSLVIWLCIIQVIAVIRHLLQRLLPRSKLSRPRRRRARANDREHPAPSVRIYPDPPDSPKPATGPAHDARTPPEHPTTRLSLAPRYVMSKIGGFFVMTINLPSPTLCEILKGLFKKNFFLEICF